MAHNRRAGTFAACGAIALTLTLGCSSGEETMDAGAIDAGGGADTGGALDAPATDAGEIDGGAIDVDAGDFDAGTPADAGGGSCGTGRPSLTGITGTEGLVIARDGTIYFSQSRYVGRMDPSGTIDDRWLALPGSPTTVWGLALDAANTTLFVGSPSGGGNIFSIDVTAATPSATTLTSAPTAPNGLTMGPDGALYYSDFGANSVWRIDAAGGTPTQVTTSSIAQANGVAFDADGTLLVCSYGAGTLVRLTLSGGVETARATVATGLGSPDGVAVDAAGDYWVTNNSAGRLLHVRASDGMVSTISTGALLAPASVEFGAGPLVCTDIYVATGGALYRYEMGTVAGAAVPWH